MSIAFKKPIPIITVNAWLRLFSFWMRRSGQGCPKPSQLRRRRAKASIRIPNTTIDGILSFIVAFRAARNHALWWPLLLEGIAGIGVGSSGRRWRPSARLLARVARAARWLAQAAPLDGAWKQGPCAPG
jgi:hypothetical protein